MDEMTTQPMTLAETGAGAMSISRSREAQEVQAAVFMAKTFPRDETKALARIEQACKRPGLAEKAIYSYPKGGKNVTGPSIRLAEAVAQSWGNMQFGVVELEQRPGASDAMAYAWDIETNTRDMKVFTVPHVRHTNKGDYPLTDPREIYESVANNGARRKRACILAIIPKDIIDAAMGYCMRTLAGGSKEPLIDRLRKMLSVFQSELSVPQESIERYIGYKIEAFTEADLQTLRGIYTAIKDGVQKREAYFTLPKIEEQEETEPEALPEPKKGKKVAKLSEL